MNTQFIPPKKSRRGITMFELLVGLVMIGIMTGMAASRIDWMKYRADSVVRTVMAELNSAQRIAVSLQENVRVVVLDSARLQIIEDGNDDNALSTGERSRMVVLPEGYLFAKGSAANTPSPEDPTTLTVLTYRRDGTANRGGTFYVHQPGSADPACKHCRAVAVNRAIGRAVVYSYATGAWKRLN